MAKKIKTLIKLNIPAGAARLPSAGALGNCLSRKETN